MYSIKKFEIFLWSASLLNKYRDHMLRYTVDMRSIYILFFLILFCSSTVLLHAHGGGASYEATIDNFFVDIGYDPAVPIAGEIIRFDFNVENERSTSTEEIFTDVWVRVKYEDEVYFSGGIYRPVFGPTGFAYVPTQPGVYDVFARFQNESNKIVEAEFSIEVLSDDVNKAFVSLYWIYALIAAMGIIFGLAAPFFFRRKPI